MYTSQINNLLVKYADLISLILVSLHYYGCCECTYILRHDNVYTIVPW